MTFGRPTIEQQQARRAQVLREGLDAMREKLPFLFEYIELDAQLKRKKYLVLIANGFTEAQALELCRKD